jgi:enterochelin esterase family protein
MATAATYQLGPDSMRRPGVPQGVISKFHHTSKIYTDIERDYWVYVPHQYDAGKPAAVMVFQDGFTYLNEEGLFRAPIVFDNLIHNGEMPVTIGIFVNPGHYGDPHPTLPYRASNRSVEYDTLSDKYVRFLLDEIFPEVRKQWNLSEDPDLHAIGGLSSGAICSFTAAWERPDAFRKVLSHIGSFTDIRGGHNYPSLIRQHAIRPIRIFLQDGTNDLNNDWGNWWLANLQMVSALEYRGYDYKFVEGTGAHDGQQGGAILPDSLRWLWRTTP